MSFTFTRVLTDLPPHITAQVLELAAENLTDVSLLSVPPSNLMYDLYQYGITQEIGYYIGSIGGGSDIKAEMVLAFDNHGHVVGFLLYLLVTGCPDACGVTYMAVSARHRRQGIARGMVSVMLENYPHAGLSCVIEKVPVYEALGFQVIGRRSNQVEMNTRSYVANGMMPTLNVAPLYETGVGLQIQALLVQKHGRKAISDAQKQLARNYERGQDRVQRFVVEYLGKLGKVPIC